MLSRRSYGGGRFIPVVLLAVAGAMLWSIYSGFHIPSTISDVRLATAERRVIEDSFAAKGVFVRDEEVYISPVAGVAELLAGDGTMVRARASVARVVGTHSRYWQEQDVSQGVSQGASRGTSQGAVTLDARSPGIVRYSIDGLESILRYGSLPALTLEEPALEGLTSLRKPHERVKNGDKVDAGAAIFKIVDPTHLAILVYGPAGDIGRLFAGKQAWVKFPGMGLDPVPGRITRLHVAGSALITLDEWVRGADGQRFVDVQIVSDIVEGVAVPVEAVVKRGGKTLVYISRRSGISMREVSVRARNSRYAIVEGIDDGQAVITNPLVLERQGV